MNVKSHNSVYNSNNKRDYQVIKHYLEKGDLYNANSVFSAEDRMSAGLKLATDFFLGRFETVKASDLSRVKVDSSFKIQQQDGAIYHQQLYLAAMNSLPDEYWDVVRLVCVENKEIKAHDKSQLRRKNIIFHLKQKLIDGLDYLVRFYRKRNIEL